MSGFSELGLDPRRIIVLHASDAGSALRAAADALTCNALGAVVLELWGETKVVDLRASRKLTLATQASGVTNILLRIAAHPVESAAMTRWVVRSAPSDAFNDCWGGPVFDAELSRNRRGQTGRWIMEWNSDARSFSAAADHGGLVAIPADRPHRTAAHSAITWRRTG